MESLDELMVGIKEHVEKWEEMVLGWVYQVAREVAVMVLEEVDEELKWGREAGLRVVGRRWRWVTTLFGDIKIRRRMYRDSRGKTRFLLDEAMGLRRGSQASAGVEKLATYLCSYLSFGKSAQLLAMLMPQGISHTTIHRLVGRVVGPHLEEEAREIEEVYQDGVIPESQGRVVSHLMVEADGSSIALQREEEKRGEAKIGIAYEGWEAVGEGRYRLREKTSYAGMMDGERFWEGFSLVLARKYDLGKVGQVIVGSDGADWAKKGAEWLGGIHQLDRFHLLRALRRGLPEEKVMEVYRACIEGDVARADGLVLEAQLKAKGELRQEIGRVRGYLLSNGPGLRDYRLEVGFGGMRGLGAIESNVDKLIANRLKKRGMSWTKAGANRMLRLIQLREAGELDDWIARRSGGRKKDDGGEACRVEAPAGPPTSLDHVWLEAGLPALHGPHPNRPWVKALSGLCQATSARYPHTPRIPPTKC